MSDLISVAKRLRVVKRAYEEFLFRELIDAEVIGPLLLDRLAADLSRPGPGGSRAEKSSLQSPMPNVDEL